MEWKPAFLFACIALAAPAASAADDFAAQVVKDNKAVKDAKVDNGVLLAGVLDNGTDRKGLAQVICMDAPPDVRRVRIMDVQAAVAGKWRELGTAECKH